MTPFLEPTAQNSSKTRKIQCIIKDKEKNEKKSKSVVALERAAAGMDKKGQLAQESAGRGVAKKGG